MATLKSVHFASGQRFFVVSVWYLCSSVHDCSENSPNKCHNVFVFCQRKNLGLSHQCKQYEESEDEYRQLMNLSDVAGTQPDGYLVRFPFYILAERDAHVVFTESESPDWFADNVYEFGNVNRFTASSEVFRS